MHRACLAVPIPDEMSDTMGNLLKTKPRDSVNVCWWMKRRVKGLSSHYAITKAVVYITRGQYARNTSNNYLKISDYSKRAYT